jgi:aryl-alcohol dehydrogenase-like predicted oxidoreductase
MRYKLLGRSGLKVSELCLGTMSFGTEWGTGAEKEESKKVFDRFAEAGGNFLDTANRYTEGTSEKFLGEFMGKERDKFVVATKYSLFTKRGDLNDAGNSRKNMFRSVEGSLKRLGTDYIDVLYVHMWDFTTPMDEVLRGLDDLIRMGKVTYIAVSDSPAWVVSASQVMAELKGWSQFVAFQAEYNLIKREAERDILPMCEQFDITCTSWAPIAGGALSGKYLKDADAEGRIKPESVRRNERSNQIVGKVIEIANELGVSATQVAMNWHRQNRFRIIPVIGARKESQIIDSLGCLDFEIPADKLSILNELTRIEPGFPHDLLHSAQANDLLYGGMVDKFDNHRSK